MLVRKRGEGLPAYFTRAPRYKPIEFRKLRAHRVKVKSKLGEINRVRDCRNTHSSIFAFVINLQLIKIRTVGRATEERTLCIQNKNVALATSIS